MAVYYVVPRGRHAKSRRHFMFFTCMIMLGSLLTLLMSAPPANASITPGNAALNWAEYHATGCWYTWGGTNCAQGYDCSGLASQAFLHGAGIWIGRDTYTQLATNGEGHFHWIPLSDIQRGDLVFFGWGAHVEIATVWWHQTFGSHDWGTRVGWLFWGSSWPPGTSAYRVW